MDVNIKKLAELARVPISEEELKSFEKEIPQILELVGQIKEANAEVKLETGLNYNVFRKDENPNERGSNTNALVKLFSRVKNGALAVRKIITQK